MLSILHKGSRGAGSRARSTPGFGLPRGVGVRQGPRRRRASHQAGAPEAGPAFKLATIDAAPTLRLRRWRRNGAGTAAQDAVRTALGASRLLDGALRGGQRHLFGQQTRYEPRWKQRVLGSAGRTGGERDRYQDMPCRQCHAWGAADGLGLGG